MEPTPELKVRMIHGHDILAWMIGVHVARAEGKLGKLTYVVHGAGNTVDEAKFVAVHRLLGFLAAEAEAARVLDEFIYEKSEAYGNMPWTPIPDQDFLNGSHFSFRRGKAWPSE